MINIKDALKEITDFADPGRTGMASDVRRVYDAKISALVYDLRLSAETAVNSFGADTKKLAESILSSSEEVKELFTDIAAAWVEFYAGKGAEYSDERNRIAVERCEELADTAEFSAFMKKLNMYSELFRIGSQFVSESIHMHRTLMQTFTGTVMYALAASDPEGMGRILNGKCTFPLI